jgi:hypothetical protein
MDKEVEMDRRIRRDAAELGLRALGGQGLDWCLRDLKTSELLMVGLSEEEVLAWLKERREQANAEEGV